MAPLVCPDRGAVRLFEQGEGAEDDGGGDDVGFDGLQQIVLQAQEGDAAGRRELCGPG